MPSEWYQNSPTTSISPTKSLVFAPEFYNICTVWSILWMFLRSFGLQNTCTLDWFSIDNHFLLIPPFAWLRIFSWLVLLVDIFPLICSTVFSSFWIALFRNTREQGESSKSSILSPAIIIWAPFSSTGVSVLLYSLFAYGIDFLVSFNLLVALYLLTYSCLHTLSAE